MYAISRQSDCSRSCHVIQNVHAADVLRVCESHVLEMIEAVSQLLLVSAQPLLQQVGAGNKKALTQAQELHAK